MAVEGITKHNVRKLLYHLGFPKAPTWSEEKLREMGLETTRHVPIEDVPEEFQETYRLLKAARKSRKYFRWYRPK